MMPSYSRFISLIFLMSVVPSVSLAEDLVGIYRLAVKNDARFAAARGAYQAGIEKYPQGRALLLPTISINADKTNSDSEITYRGSTSFEGGERRYQDEQYKFTVTQPIYRQQNFATYSQGKAQREIAEAQLSAAQQDLMLRAAQAYFDLLTAQQALTTASAHVAATMAQYDQTKARLQVGAATRLENNEARARASLARSQEIASRHDVTNKRQALRRIIQEAPGPLHELPENLPLIAPSPSNVSVWIERVESDNAQLRALRHSVTAAEKEVVRARGGHHPTLDLQAQYSSADSTGSVYTAAESDTRIKSIGLRFELPLYAGGSINSRVREAIANLERTRAELEDTRRDLTSQVFQHFNGVVSGIDQVRALEQALIASQDAAKGSRIGREVGTRSFVEVLDAEKQVFDVQRELAKARHEYLMSWLKLKATVGQLTEDDLINVNNYLEPPKHGSPLEIGTADNTTGRP